MSNAIKITLQDQIDLVRQLMQEELAQSYLLMPYYKKLLEIGSRGDLEPKDRPWIEEL